MIYRFFKNIAQTIVRFFTPPKTKHYSVFVQKELHLFHSQIMGYSVKLDIYEPVFQRSFSKKSLKLLLLNDGQDLLGMDFQNQLQDLIQRKSIAPLLAVGIYPHDRMQEYGTAHRADYAGRGSRAADYTRFVTTELLPFLEQSYVLSPKTSDRAFAGFSLGGLSAFDIVWNHPKQFGAAGIFSGALWWRSEPFDATQPDAHRIAHDMVWHGGIKGRHHQRFWLQAGTADETADRNNNGVIDAIDDTLDLINALEKVGFDKKNTHYTEVKDGKHHPNTWKIVLPDFLQWAFAL